ncbi:MAG: sigma 54-interacting transcriptional regulator [Bacteroidota bacterium]
MKAPIFLVGESSAIKKLNKQIFQLAGSSRNVLIQGETGAGKTTVARHLFLAGKDRAKPFFTIDPSLTSDEEIKAIFFRDELRRDEEAAAKQIPELIDGSTVYANDIEDLSFSNQSRLARFLDSKKGKPKVRLIAAVKESIEKCFERGMIVEALFNQLSTFEKIYIAPLRERPEDIPALAEQFIVDACKELGIRVKTLDANTLDFLAKFDWKDNVRGLKAVIDKSVHQTEGEALTLPREILDERSHLQGIINNIELKKRFSMDLGLENIEKLLLQRMLKAFGYNQSRVAEALGITEGNLRYRLKKYSIPSSRQR